MSDYTAEPIRTARPNYQGGRIYECDPAAVARLKQLMVEQRQAQEAAEAARLARQNDDAARLITAAKRRKAQRQPAEPAATPDVTRPKRATRRKFTGDQLTAAMTAHDAGKPWREIAAEMGIARTSLTDALRRHGFRANGAQETT